MKVTYPPLAGRWFPLSDRAVFRITGPDRVRFLNGQVSNDVSGPLGREAVAACLCTLKGKVEALVWIHATEDSLVLDGELRQRESILGRLERYLISDDCEIADITGETAFVHHFQEGAGGIRSRRLYERGFDLLVEEGSPLRFDPDQRIAEDELELLRTLSLVPESGKEINGDEFPAELGLETWAVSFHKGCYLGQEIVSRIQSVGKVKRRLRLIALSQSAPAGTSVVNSLGETGLTTRGTRPLMNFFFPALGLFRSQRAFSTLPLNEALEARRSDEGQINYG